MKRIFVVLTSFLLLTGCDTTSPEQPASGHVDFSDLQVGQSSWYIGFRGGNIYDAQADFFEYVADTLILEVAEQTETGFVFLEQIRPGSQSLALWQDSIRYHVSIVNDALSITPINIDALNSALFLVSNHAFQLNPLEDNEALLDGVKITSEAQGLLFTGFIQNHTQLNQQFEHLNFLTDASATPVDGPAYTIIYNRSSGIVRSFTTSVWTGEATGWDLLP